MSTLTEMAEAYESIHQPDPLDRASALAELALSAAIANRVRYEGESAEFCDDCDAPIPLKRREAVKGCRLCVDCANSAEQKLRNAGGLRGRN